MAKTKTPFLSLGSQGSIGGTITTQRRHGSTLVRTKPTPTDPYSLPQAYQRWLYSEVSHLFTLLTESQKAVYRAAGARLHLTAFQHWLSVQLPLMPYFKALYKLDETAGSLAYDSSPFANTATVYGCTPINGLISKARYFDGLDNRIIIPNKPQINNLKTFSWELYYYHTATTWWGRLVDKLTKCLSLAIATDRLLMVCYAPTNAEAWDSQALITGHWYHIVCNYDDTGDRKPHIFKNGSEITYSYQVAAVGALTSEYNSNLYLGNRAQLDLPLNGIIDHFTIRNRTLDQCEITKHSQRRWPPQ